MDERIRFTTMLVHELKAPLAAVEGYLRIMKDRGGGERLADYDEIVDRCIERMGQAGEMVADLLTLTRLETPGHPRKIEMIDLRDLARHAVEAAAPAAAVRKMTLEHDVPMGTGIRADALDIELIVGNMLSNAVKYNREGGTARLQISREGDVVVIRVSDTGIGLSPDETARLFEQFVRIKNDKTRGTLGTGLGLWIVRQLARRYGGDVSVTSTPDLGSTFVVTLHDAG